MQKNILLTGYSGFLGSYFYNHLKLNYKIDTLGKNSNNTITCDISKTFFISIIGTIIPYFPINKNSFKKMSTSLTVCSEKAKKELHWNPKSLTNNFKIK